jgi:hypothetical protein
MNFNNHNPYKGKDGTLLKSNGGAFNSREGIVDSWIFKWMDELRV